MKITPTLDNKRARDVFKRLLASTRDMEPLMSEIAEGLLNSSRERFRTEKGPDGQSWAEVTNATKARNKRNVDRILRHDGYLGGNINTRTDRNFIEIGSTRI